jgi:hypothetical protein
MAKVSLPLMSILAKDKLGGIVFMRRMGKNVVRVKVTPANPKTDKQTVVRYNLEKLNKAFYGKEDANGKVTLKKIDTSTTPWTLTDVEFNVLTNQERVQWKYVWNFIKVNQKRLYNNLAPVRTP